MAAKAAEPEREGGSMIESILAAIEIAGKIPGAAAGIARLGRTVQNLLKAKNKKPEEDSPLGRVVKGQKDRLDKHINDYHAIDADPKYDEIEKDKYRRRVAAQACDLLKQSQPIKDQIPDYNTLVEFFCQFIPSLSTA
jgi:hypothetical protein